MPHPVPETPTNVQASNPYTGLDRGLFLLRGANAGKYARIHAAKWVSNGPLAAVGRLEFQIMSYPTKPTTRFEYASGTLLAAPGGGDWFDCLTRGLVDVPIMAEYWAINTYLKHYAEGGVLLTPAEKDPQLVQGKAFTGLVGGHVALTDILYTVNFVADAGNPLARVSTSLQVTRTVNGAPVVSTLTPAPVEPADPVHKAIEFIKTL